jgi:hypothetical protein
MQRLTLVSHRFVGTTHQFQLERSKQAKKSMGCLTLEDGTDRFSRNIGKSLPMNAA